jgi:hypothetical protein
MFQNVGKKKKTPRAPAKKKREKAPTVDGQPMNPLLQAAFAAEGLAPQPAFVNVVVLDNTVPGGFRYEQRVTG